MRPDRPTDRQSSRTFSGYAFIFNVEVHRRRGQGRVRRPLIGMPSTWSLSDEFMPANFSPQDLIYNSKESTNENEPGLLWTNISNKSPGCPTLASLFPKFVSKAGYNWPRAGPGGES